MRRISLLWKVVRITHAERFAVGYVLLLFLVAVAVWLAEPSITILADSLWYCFAASTTIGFGDFVAVTWGGRICHHRKRKLYGNPRQRAHLHAHERRTGQKAHAAPDGF